MDLCVHNSNYVLTKLRSTINEKKNALYYKFTALIIILIIGIIENIKFNLDILKLLDV